jgi:hypothetical protein
VKRRPSSVSTGIFTAQVSLTQRLPPTSRGVTPTKLILGNYVNIKSKARPFAQLRNRKGVDVEPSLGSECQVGPRVEELPSWKIGVID